jgi:hypothetical protein
MPFFRLKHSFTAGELSPLMNDRIDFERYRNGCKVLQNMFCATQGPAVRRPGFKFVYDIGTLGQDPARPQTRLIPFVFSELQAYAMLFFYATDGTCKVVFATTNQDGTDGLVVSTGIQCEYDTESVRDYTGTGDYTFNYPPGSTVTANKVWHVAADGTRTDLVEATDYTIAYDNPNGVATVSVTNGTITGGALYCELTVQVPAIPALQVVSLTMPDGFDLETFDWAQSGDEMYIAQSELQPLIIQRHDHECWQLVQVTFQNQPDDWSDEYGWPERVTFHQQRLCFAANKIRRQTVWLSKAGDYSDFGINSPLLDSDAVTFTIASGKQNRIQWITSSKSLHIGTLGDEWTVSGNDQSALTPTNILSQRQTNSGSETNKPLMIGITTMFIEQHGRVINEFVYDYTYDSYKTSDMAILSPHLTEFEKVVDWTFQRTPDSIIWSVRGDGVLLGITYQRQHKVVGWHRHDTQGKFETITSIPGITREDDVWVVVNRTIDGVEKRYLEKLADWFKSDVPDDGRFLDSHSIYQGPPATTISGLTHLANTEVDILADGTVHPPKRVDSLGRLILNNQYSHVVIGLPYVSEVRPHLADADIRDGTSRGRTQRITNVSIDLYRSLGMYVGRWDREDGEFEEEIPFRVPGDLLGHAVPLFTGWYKLAFPEGFDEEAEYFIRQKQPLPLTVRGVVDEVEVYD